MPYGLDAVIAPPPLSGAFSLLLLAGCDAVGLHGGRLFFHFAREGAPGWERWQAPVLGALLLGVILFPLALLGFAGVFVLRPVAALLALAGAFHGWRRRRQVGRILRGLPSRFRDAGVYARIAFGLVLLMAAALAFIALGPVTNADALDYHIGIALRILENGGFPQTPEWFHGRLAGSGEVLNALGLAVGAEAFGALLQYAGLVGLTALLSVESRRAVPGAPGTERAALLALLLISSSVVLFLASAPKPQLLPQAMVTLALALVVTGGSQAEDARPLRQVTLVYMLALSAVTARLSFLVTGGLVCLAGLAVGWRRRQLLPTIVIAFSVACALLLPHVLWKVHVYGADFVSALLEPLPGRWPGTAEFAADLRAYTDGGLPFPLSIFVPASPGTISTVLGIAPLFVLALRPRSTRVWLVLGAAAFAVAGYTVLGQRTSRFYFDALSWLLLAMAIAEAREFRPGGARWLAIAQGLGTATLAAIGAFMLFPGALSPGMREAVMRRSADGYTVMRWADGVLPADAVLLSVPRSLALAPRPAVSFDWVTRMGDDERTWRPYLELLRERGITHMLHVGAAESTGVFRDCLGARIAGPYHTRTATRNPFNRGPVMTAYVSAIDVERLPDCALAAVRRHGS